MSYEDDIVQNIRLRAVDETGSVTRELSKKIEELAGGFKSLTLGTFSEETIRRSYEGYAQLTRTLERTQLAIKATNTEMAELGKIAEEAGEKTGRSTDEMVNAMKMFAVNTGQVYGPQIGKVFETIAEASRETGAAVEDLGRASAAAMNNLKVPAEDMDTLIKQWVVTLPAAMADFASKAPTLTASAQAIGLSGKETAQQLGVMFDTVNTAIGSPQQAFRILNSLMEQSGNASTNLGRVMVPQMLEIQKNGGSAVDVFKEMMKQLTVMGAFDPGRRPFLQEQFGLSINDLKGLDALRELLGHISDRMISGADAAKQFGDANTKMGNDSLSALHKLEGAFEGLRNAFGELLETMGASDAIRGVVDQLQSVRRLMDDISHGEYKKAFQEAFRPVGGAIPGEHDSLMPQHTPSIMNKGWFESGIDAWRGLGGGGASARSSAHEPPKMAEGGVVNRPTLAEIGEDGPEAVIPLNRFGGGGATTDNTSATKDNTEAINRLSGLMRSSLRGAPRTAAYTPGAGELPTPVEAGMYGGGGASGGWGGGGGNVGGGGGGTFGGGGASGGWGGDESSSADDPGGTVPEGMNTNDRLAAQRSSFFNNLDPATKKLVVQAALAEGGERGLQANIEQMLNYGNARGMTNFKQVLHSGFYGPVNRGEAQRRAISTRAWGKANAALEAARRGSNKIDYRIDQGMPGDPNYAREAHDPRFRGKRIDGAFFADHPTIGRGWAARQHRLDAEAAATAAAHPSAPTHAMPNAATSDFRDHNSGAEGAGGAGQTREGVPSTPHELPAIEVGPQSSLEHYRAMRREMERPIRLSIEAPTAPPQMAGHRSRMGRQEQYYQAERTLGRFREAGNVDIGYG